MKLKTLFLLSLLFSMKLNADGHAHAKHGFVVFGDNQTHLYHLARFNSPHQWQGLFEVTFKDANGKKLSIAAIRAKLPKGTVLSLASDNHFPLEELADSKPLSFPASLYEGYLRSNDKKLIQAVIVTRKTVEYFKEILPTDAKNNRPKLILVCDSTTNRFSGAHLVAGSPSFEELVGIDALFTGSPEEAPSKIYPCTNEHQGSVVTILNREDDKPLDDPYSLEIQSPVLDEIVSLAGVKRLVLDAKAIN